VPSAAVIADEVGLQPSVTGEYDPLNVGGAWSAVHDTDLDIVAELLQPSTAVNVLTCVTTQPAVVAGASLNEILVTAPQPSVADAVPRAAVIADEVGLQPSVTGEYDPLNVGGVRSLVQETDLDIVAELLQPSTAVNVLTCVTTQPAVVAGASLNEILVTAPQPSVADAEPSAAVISVGKGLQPSATGEYVPLNVGGVRSLVQDTDLDIVAELLQPSTAVNVLICVTIQPAVVAGASENEILVTAPQPSVAVAVPSAAVIADEVGLQPSVTGEYVPVNVGGVRSEVQDTVLDIVAELLQPSTAVNVLT
jgi:hypothetical protein